MSARTVALLLLSTLGLVLAGCGGSGPEIAPPPDDGGGAQTHEIGPLLVRTASAPGFVAEEIPNEMGGVNLVALYGSQINYLASQAMLDRIVFASTRGGSAGNLWVCNLDGSGLVRLTNNTATEASPVFTPDGTGIAFARRWPAEDWEIIMINSDGSGPRALTSNTSMDAYPSFAPEGRRIAFSSDRTGNFEVFGMFTDGSGATNLTNHAASDIYPDWSPSMDEPRILFASNRVGGNHEIWRMNADGSNLIQLTNSPTPDFHPTFSPFDGRMVYQAMIQGNAEVALANTTSSLSPVDNFTGSPGNQSAPCWSSDGRFICYSSDLTGERLVLQESGEPYTKYVVTSGTATDAEPDLGSPTMQVDRVIIGPSGSDWGGADPIWTNAYAGIAAYGAYPGSSGPVAVTAARPTGYSGFVRIGIDAADVGSIEVSPLAQPQVVAIRVGAGYPVLGVVVEATRIANLRQDGGRKQPPILWNFAEPKPTALVIYFDSYLGSVVSVMVLRDQSYPAAAGGAAVTQSVEDGALVAQGSFGAVYDATGERIADQASAVSFSAGAVNVVR